MALRPKSTPPADEPIDWQTLADRPAPPKLQPSPWEYKSGLAAVDGVTAVPGMPSVQCVLNDHAAQGWEPIHISHVMHQAGHAALIVLRRPFKHPKVGSGES